ncbi:hypothetical protein CDIK_1792 [Cucumispora dikerogammari]|nr:hypothetical protein CDIK_1792 [Cucumispora dikerogammari]
MLEYQLTEIKKHKKTTDLYTKPLITFNSKCLTAEDIEDSFIFQTKYSNKNIDRLSLTAKEENKFKKKISKYLISLLPRMREPGIESILDFHIFYHQIDRMNKDDLLFLLLPHSEYNKKTSILMGTEEFSIKDISKKLDNLEFLGFFMQYFDFFYLENIKQFVEKVLTIYFAQKHNIRNEIAGALMNEFMAIEDKKFGTHLYDMLIKKTDLRIEDIENDFEEKECRTVKNDSQVVYESRPTDKRLYCESKHSDIKQTVEIKNVQTQGSIKNFLSLCTQEKHTQILNETSDAFKSQHRIEILKHLITFTKPNFSQLLPYLTEQDLLELSQQTTNANIYELFMLKSADLFKKTFILSNEPIPDDLLLFILGKELFEFDFIINSNLERIYEKINEDQTNLHFLLYEFAVFQDNDKYNKIIKHLIKLQKLPILDLDRLSSGNKKKILLKPELFFENDFEEIIEKIKHFTNKPKLIKTKFDLIDFNGIEDKIIRHIISKLSSVITNKKKYLQALLVPPLNDYLIDYIDYKPIQIILKEVCLIDSHLIIEKLLINKQKLKDNLLYFEKLINEKKGDMEIRSILEKYIEKYLNDELYLDKQDPIINLKLVEICLDFQIQLISRLNSIFKLLEVRNEQTLLDKLVTKYKKILTPYLGHIIRFSPEQHLMLFEGEDVLGVFFEPNSINSSELFPCLKQEKNNISLELTSYLKKEDNKKCIEKTKKLAAYLKKAEITQEMFEVLNEKLSIPLLEVIFKNSNINKLLENQIISSTIHSFLVSNNENTLLDFIHDTINNKNIIFFKKFYQLLYLNFKINEKAKFCFQKLIDLAPDLEIKHSLLINEILNDEKQADTVAFILKHKNNLEFTKNFNERILVEFKREEIKLLNLFKSIYTIFPEFKAINTEVLPYLYSLLENEDEGVRVKAKNLIAYVDTL